MTGPIVSQVDWFTIAQTVGIIFSILFASYSALKDSKSRKVSNYLQLTAYHRDVWSMAMNNPDLLNIRNSKRDILVEPISAKEHQFLIFLFLHITCTYELIKNKSIIKIEGLEYDIRQLLIFPAVRKFWEENKQYYNDGFVQYVEESAKI